MISTVDTHELVKDLKASGFTDAQAEAVTRAVRQTQDFSDLATKSALALPHDKLREGMAVLRGETVASGQRLIKWVIGVGIAQVLVSVP